MTPCSPLLRGVDDPVHKLRVLSKNPVLLYSEPPQVMRELAESGWLKYQSGCWRITEEGKSVLTDTPEEPLDFFEL